MLDYGLEMWFLKTNKKDSNEGRKSIRGIVRCECPKHKCERFSKYRDYLCDDCFHEKIKCYNDSIPQKG